MNHHLRHIAFVALCLISLGADWPTFRGENNSVSKDAAPPAVFSEKENRCVAWKVEMPARGVSSPIVVKDRVYVTASGGFRQDRMNVLCFDGDSGKQLWRREFWATGRTLCHPTSANAAPTPASDGERIFAFFSSNDLACLDLDGNLLWYRGLAHDYPKAGNDVGMAASPLVVEDTVIVQIENEGDSFAAGLDTSTGENKWRIDRDRTANWSSPSLLPGSDGKPDQVLLQTITSLTAHDPLTGQEIWRYKANTGGIASPAAIPGQVFLASNGLTVLNVPPGSSAPSLAWDSNQLRPGPASPIIDGELVYAIDGAGILKGAKLSDGKVLWQLRVGGAHWATPVIAGNQMYCINQEGKMRVIKLADKPELIGESDFGEPIHASAAIANGALYVRSDKHLWKIAN